MNIDELRKNTNENWFNPEDITEKLMEITQTEGEEVYKDIEEALYQLKAIAQNEYNNDYYRTLYNVLLMLCDC